MARTPTLSARSQPCLIGPFYLQIWPWTTLRFEAGLRAVEEGFSTSNPADMKRFQTPADKPTSFRKPKLLATQSPIRDAKERQ